MHGHASETPKDSGTISGVTAKSSSPEFRFGLRLEEALKTNNLGIITSAFDFDAYTHRYVPSLPVADGIKEKLYALPRNNPQWRRQVSLDVIEEAKSGARYFLGMRKCGNDYEALFGDLDVPRDNSNFAVIRSPRYVGYVLKREADGSIGITDVHQFNRGELLSQAERRGTLVELIKDDLLVQPVPARDAAYASGGEAIALFDSRCQFGQYNLIKDAYNKLPQEVQNDRCMLFRVAMIGEKNFADFLAPMEHWRQLYPDDPSPNLLLANTYWRLYHAAPSGATSSNFQPVEGWTDAEEAAAVTAIQRANEFFADPAMDIRLARYFERKKPDQARALLHTALKRYPVQPLAFGELFKMDLTVNNFAGVFETLRLEESTYHTNLTAMVEANPDFAAFRKSFDWKKWQHEDHGAELQSLSK